MTLPATPSSHSFSWARWASRICSAGRKPPVVAGVSPAKNLDKSQPTRLPLQFPAVLRAGGPLLALVRRDWNRSWYRLHERNLISGIRWNVQWPEQAPNFRKLKID